MTVSALPAGKAVSRGAAAGISDPAGVALVTLTTVAAGLVARRDSAVGVFSSAPGFAQADRSTKITKPVKTDFRSISLQL
jgi:hypothetical protein